MRPGEYFFANGDIELNSDKASFKIIVKNTGDRPIQVGSHFHFFETNRALKFDRPLTLGKRLNILSGTAVRFEPGQTHEVELIDLGGSRQIIGFNRLVEGPVDDQAVREKALQNIKTFLGES